MEKVKQHLNSIALALISLALVSLFIWPHKKIIALVAGAGGIAVLALYIILNLPSLQEGFKRRSFIYSSNMFFIIILVLGILILVNYFFARHHYRFDFTESKIHSLSDQSINVLKNLKNDVHVRCFFLEGNIGRARMENLLKIYNYHSKKIKFEFIDPDKNPGLVKRYDVTTDGTSIFECGDKESRITATSEEDITNAIIKVSREKKKVIYFLEGHGEGSIENSMEDGYSQAKTELEKLAYEVKNLKLALSETFPEDCTLLIIPGPEKDLLPDELETIRNFINRGGRAFFMVDPETAAGLQGFLKEFGIQLENDLIVDTVSRLVGGDYFMPIVSDYEYHEITHNFNIATFFPYARSVNETEETPEGVSTTILAKTSAQSWSERQLDVQQVTFDRDKDVPGPVPIAAVATIEPREEEEAGEKDLESEETEEIPERPKKEGRLAVFGDSDFISNRYYYLSGNGNLFLNTVNWLTEEADLISIQPRTARPRTIQMTATQGRALFLVSVVLLPLAVIVIGGFIWARRRSL